MTRRAVITQADLVRAADAAKDKGVQIVVRLPDGTVYEFTPTGPKQDPFDNVDFKA